MATFPLLNGDPARAGSKQGHSRFGTLTRRILPTGGDTRRHTRLDRTLGDRRCTHTEVCVRRNEIPARAG